MALESKIREDLKEALKRHEDARISTLRLLLSEIHNTQIAKQRTLDDEAVVEVISKEVKRRRESIEGFTQGKRDDLVAKEEQELGVLLEYLPRQLSREELANAAREAIDEVGAQGMKDKGKVMSRLMPRVKGQAEGAEVSEVVSELLGRT
ncbi:MAG: GatB/YqeY domain-containing protein [Chloroflexota bacterium]